MNMSSQMFQQFAGVKQNTCSYVSQNSQENTCTGVSFLINRVAGLHLQPIFVIKKTPPLVFSWKLCEIFNENFFNTW